MEYICVVVDAEWLPIKMEFVPQLLCSDVGKMNAGEGEPSPFRLSFYCEQAGSNHRLHQFIISMGVEMPEELST
jgi:hypothetical protein